MKKIFILLIIIQSTLCIADEKNSIGETIITKQGHQITMSNPAERHINVVNTKICKTTYNVSVPLLLNGNNIFRFDGEKTDTMIDFITIYAWVNELKKIESNINTAIENEKQTLAPGTYDFKAINIVISELGEIVYFQSQGVARHKNEVRQHVAPKALEISEETYNTLNEKITAAIYTTKFSPLVINGKATPYLNSYHYSFTVKEDN